MDALERKEDGHGTKNLSFVDSAVLSAKISLVGPSILRTERRYNGKTREESAQPERTATVNKVKQNKTFIYQFYFKLKQRERERRC